MVNGTKLLQGIYKIQNKSITSSSPDEIANVFLDIATEMTASNFGFIAEINDSGFLDTISISNAKGKSENIPNDYAIKAIEGMQIRGIYADAIKQESSKISDITPEALNNLELPYENPKLTVLLTTPLIHNEKVFGIVVLGNKSGGYSKDDKENIEVLSTTFIHAFISKRYEVKLSRSKNDLEFMVKLRTTALTKSDVERRSEILNKKEIEKSLIENEHRFKRLFENAPVGMYWSNTSGEIKMVNPAFLEMLGYNSLKELTSHRNTEDIYLRKKDFHEFQKIISNEGIIFEYETFFKKKNGEVITVLESANLLNDNYGDEKYYEGIVQDITEKRRAENDFERLMQNLQERVQELQCINGLDEAIRKQKNIEELFKDTSNLLPSCWKYKDVTRGKVTYDGKEYVSEPFEETSWKLSSEIIVNGEPRGSLSVFCLEQCPQMDGDLFSKSKQNLIDGLAKRISEAIELDQANQQLSEAYKIINRSPAVTFLWKNDEGWPVIFVSHNIVELSGYSSQEFMEGRVLYSELIHGEDIERVAEEVATKNDKEYHDSYSHSTYRIISKDGNIKWVDDLTFVRKNSDGKITHFEGIVIDITERKETSNSLQESELKYRLLADHTYDWEYWLGPDKKYKYVSPACERITGYKPSDFISNPNLMSELVRKDYVEEVIKHYSDENNRDASVISLEFPIKAKNGKEIWIEHNCTPVFDDDGNYLGRRGNNRDITDRKDSEKSHLESENQYRALFEYSPIPLWEEDFSTVKKGLEKLRSEGVSNFREYFNENPGKVAEFASQVKIVEINKATLELHEANSKEELLQGLPTIFIAKSLISFKEELIAIADGLSKFMIEGTVGTLTGKEKSIQVNWVVVPDYEETLEKVYVSTIDITERKQGEEKQKRLSIAIEQSPASVVITDLKGNIEYVNKKFTEVTGYTFSEALNKNPRVLKSGEQKENFYKELWETILSDKVWSGEFHNKKKNGELFWESAVISPVKDEEGIITRFVAVKEDITEKKIIQDELIVAKERAERADKLKTEFLTQISHEIRTPLNSMMSFAALIEQDIGDIINEELKYSFESMKKSGDRIIRTTDLILNVSQVKTKTYDPQFRGIDLVDEIINDSIKLVASLIDESRIKFNFADHSSIKRIEGDPYSLIQIFSNLLENAFKFTEEGEILVSVYDKDDKICVDVKDTGIGMEENFIPHIFDNFIQEEQGYSRKYDGNGLGLSLVKEYCALNDIDIKIDSVKNQGSCFTLIFNKTINNKIGITEPAQSLFS